MNLEQWRVHLLAAYEQAGLMLTAEKERRLFREPVAPEQNQVVAEAYEVLTRYFFKRASRGNPFGPLDRVKERFGLTLEENYGLTEGPFMDLAKAYWTFKLEMGDFVDHDPNTGFSQVLKRIEFDVASLFFPTPGPLTVPLEKRRQTQRELLSTLAPEMDVEQFLAENPFLRAKDGFGHGMRIVPLIWGGMCCVVAVGLYYFVPHVITAIIGIFLLWLGWSSIKMALFGSQKLIDAMTLGSEVDKDEEVLEEWRKVHGFKQDNSTHNSSARFRLHRSNAVITGGDELIGEVGYSLGEFYTEEEARKAAKLFLQSHPDEFWVDIFDTMRFDDIGRWKLIGRIQRPEGDLVSSEFSESRPRDLLMARRKNPALAGVLALFLGPVGCLYVGWRYALLALLIFLLFGFGLALIGLPQPWWIKYLLLPVLAFSAANFTKVRNEHIDQADDKMVEALGTLRWTGVSLSDCFVSMGMVYAGSITLWKAYQFLSDQRLLAAILALLLTPVAIFFGGSLCKGIIHRLLGSPEDAVRDFVKHPSARP